MQALLDLIGASAPDGSDCEVDTERWMASFGHVPMPNLVMPGSHDSGAQNLNCCSTGPDWKQARGFLPLGCCVVLPWSAAQGCTAGELLRAGCRHFDLRVGIRDDVEGGTDESYRLCHGFFSRHLLADFLSEVREFLDEQSTEAVLLEVKTVMSFEDEVSMEAHDILIEFLEEKLGGKGAFVTEGERMRPLGELTAAGKQLFVVYCPGGWGHPTSPVDSHKDTMMAGYCLRSRWPNVCEPGMVCEILQDELEENAEECSNKFLILQGVQTPGATDIVKGIFGCGVFADGSLRQLAKTLYPELKSMLEDVPDEQLAHGAVVMLDWLEQQPELVSWLIHTNSRLHPL